MPRVIALTVLALSLAASAAAGAKSSRLVEQSHPLVGSYALVTRIEKPTTVVARGTLIIDTYKQSSGAITGHGTSQGYPLSMIGTVKGDRLTMTVVNAFGIAHDRGTIWPDGSITGTIVAKSPNVTETGTWQMTPKPAVPAKTVALTVTVKGTGSIILNTGQQVRCGNSGPELCSKAFNVKQGTVLSLTPVATDGSKFSSWAGDCTGTRTCVVTVKHPMRAVGTFADVGTTTNPVPLGSEGWVDDDQTTWSLKIDSVVPDATSQILALGNNPTPRPGAQDYMIVVSATSHNTDLDLGALIANLYVKTGNSFSTYGTYENGGCGTLPPPHLWDHATLVGDPATFVVQDGETATGTICFQVDTADAKSLRLFTESPFQYANGLDEPPTPDAHAHWFALR